MPIRPKAFTCTAWALKPWLVNRPGILIAIDGRCGSGKTTLGRYLAWYFNVSLIETDLYLRDGEGFSYHLDQLERVISKRIERERPLPVIIEGVAIRWILNQVKRLPDLTICVVNTGPNSGNTPSDHVISYELECRPNETSTLVIELFH